MKFRKCPPSYNFQKNLKEVLYDEKYFEYPSGDARVLTSDYETMIVIKHYTKANDHEIKHDKDYKLIDVHVENHQQIYKVIAEVCEGCGTYYIGSEEHDYLNEYQALNLIKSIISDYRINKWSYLIIFICFKAFLQICLEGYFFNHFSFLILNFEFLH